LDTEFLKNTFTAFIFEKGLLHEAHVTGRVTLISGKLYRHSNATLVRT